MRSTDHRGTEVKPGRVLTMWNTGNQLDEVWGGALLVPAEKRTAVEEYLDYRGLLCGFLPFSRTAEKDGYTATKHQREVGAV